MEAILQWGLDLIRLVQSFASPPLTAVMRIITEFGSATAYMALLPLIYWCYDERKGLRLGLAILVSAWLNLSLKFFLNQPRPFFAGYDPSVGMISERFGGLPSGHAQNSLVMWTIIASWGKRKWLFGITALICLLVSFSRIYLGVHFPSDIFGGWVLGSLVLCAYFFSGKRIEALLAKGGFRAEIYAAAAVAFIMILYRPGAEILMPGGMFLGMAAGYSLNKRYIGFKSSGLFGRTGAAKYLTLLARFVLGIAATAIILLAFEKVIPQNHFADFYLILHFLRFTVTALWVYAGAPWLFCVLHLAEVQKEA
ncbi:phosphatidic acid phosphatase [Spirochaetia bacterium]|nr:phosphatidic acid phosphatase [Spirochaetia bacterium]